MLGNLLKPEFEELLQSRDYDALRGAFSEMSPPDIASSVGAMALHGPHQVAQKSTSTGSGDSSTCLANSASEV